MKKKRQNMWGHHLQTTMVSGFFFTLEGWDTHGYPPDLVFACITLHSAACDNPQKGKLRLCYRNHSPFQLPIENGEHPQLCQIARGYHEQV